MTKKWQVTHIHVFFSTVQDQEQSVQSRIKRSYSPIFLLGLYNGFFRCFLLFLANQSFPKERITLINDKLSTSVSTATLKDL